MIDAVPQPQLFDLASDPGETQDLAAEHPEVVARLTELIEQGRRDLGDYNLLGNGQRYFDKGPRRPGGKRWLRQ